MAKNRHIPHATAGRKSHSLRAVVLTAVLLACVTAAVQQAQAQATATYRVVDGMGMAREPARPGGLAVEGRFTITLENLIGARERAGNVAFFFRLTSGLPNPGSDLTPGYGVPDPTVTNIEPLATRNSLGLDFEFILDYKAADGSSETRTFEQLSTGYTNDRDRALKAANNEYTFRVVPLHDDKDDEGLEFLLFGFRVFFSGTSNSSDLTGRVNGHDDTDGNGDIAITIDDPLPAALYNREDDAHEPATQGGTATEGEFTITLRHLNSDQIAANDVTFFFRFIADPPDPSPDQTNGFGTLDPGLLSTALATNDDFEFILDYRDVDNDRIVITDFSADSDGNYNNNASPAPRAMGDVYTFRVVPLHDNDNDNGLDGEILVFGYRVQFNGIDNSNDLHGQVNGGTHDTPVVINEPPPTATYALIDPEAVEPISPTANADSATFQITLNHLNTYQSTSNGRQFFFNFASGAGGGSGVNNTPGYGTLPDGTTPSGSPRENFRLEYLPESTTAVELTFNAAVDFTGSPVKNDSENYVFRVTPLYDTDFGEGVEHVVFGYRVFFTPPTGEGLSNEDQFRGVVDNKEGSTAITITELPNATLTRDRIFIKEGDPTPVIFTLALNSAPDGPATIVYKLEVINADTRDADNAGGDDINVEFTGTTPPHTGANNTIGDTSSTLTTTVTGGAAGVTISVTPEDDVDTTDEIVVLTIISVEVAGGDTLTAESGLICSACNNIEDFRGGNLSNALLIRLEDATDPEVQYSRTDNFAIEPPAAGADADTGTFTITLRNVDANFLLKGSADRVFTFTLRTAMNVGTLGTVPADSNDFDLYAQYTGRDGNPAIEQLYATSDILFVTTGTNTAGNSTNRIPRARRGNDDMGDEERYDFHIVPRHNADETRMEHVVFHLRAFFGSSGVSHADDIKRDRQNNPVRIDFIPSQNAVITVDNSPASTAVVILEPPLVTLTRDSPFVTEGEAGAFIFTLEAIPDGINPRTAIITYTLAADDQVGSVGFSENITNPSQPSTDGSTLNTFTMPVSVNSDSEARIIITAAEDEDRLNGTVTLTVTRVEVANITITPDIGDNFVCRDCSNGELTITILDNAGPQVSTTRTTISEMPAQPEATAVISLDLSGIDSSHGAGLINVTLSQDTDNLAVLGVDYTFKYQVGTEAEVSVTTTDSMDIDIPADQLGSNAIEFTFTSLDDNYDEGTGEDITLNLGNLMFADVIPPITLTPSLPIVTIRIEDDDEVSAALSKGGVAIERAPPNSSVPSTFVLTLMKAPDSTATVIYTLDDPDDAENELDIKYTATLEGGGIGESLSTVLNSVFTIPKDNITGANAGIEGGESGNAEATIVIHPLLDSDDTLEFRNTRYLQVDHEYVRLTIHSIRFDNGVEVGNIRNGAQTIAIRDASLTEFILNDTDTSEPLTAGATADTGTFTLRLYNLNQAQQASPLRRFFFRFAPNSDGRRIDSVVFGYGTPPDDITPADSSDFRLDYLPPDAAPVPLVLDDTFPNNYGSPDIPTNPQETYVFRVTPNHDGVDEPTEHIVFGYRIFFGSASITDQIRGSLMTGNDANPPVASIADGPSAVLTRRNAVISETSPTNFFILTLTDFDTTVSSIASITYIITVIDDTNNPDNDAIDTSLTVGAADIFSANLNNNGNASTSIGITPLLDEDNHNEVVTLTIISVAVGGLIFNSNDITCGEGEGDDLVIGECSPAGALSITIENSDAPAATYALTGRETAIEPTSATAENAVASSFTITLSNLNGFQSNPARELSFFFRFAPFAPGPPISTSEPGITPGYGTPEPGITNLATRDDPLVPDFKFILEYTVDDDIVTKEFDSGRAVYSNRSDPAFPRATVNDGNEVYTFRVVPRHDTDNEGGESLLFGYRVFFRGDGGDNGRQNELQNELKGVVNGGDGDPAITIDDGPRVTLTRDPDSITEGTEGTTGSPATLTLALDNVPNGTAAITSTIKITGDNPSISDFSAELGGVGPGARIRYVDTTGFLEDGDGTGSFNINIIDNAATFTLTIRPEVDADSDDERITYAITRIELPNNLTLGPSDFVCEDCRPAGALYIDIIDGQTPAAKYALTGLQAAEPNGADTNDAVASSFTITLSNLKTPQRRSNERQFFFRFAPGGVLVDGDLTPGYGNDPPLPPDPQGVPAATANLNDFDLDIVYTQAGSNTVTVMPLDRESGVYNSRALPKAAETEDGEVYTFLLTPSHDPGDNAGIEHVVFGYRVFFGDGVPDQVPGGENRLDGVVDGSPSSTPVMTISDVGVPMVTLTLDQDRITEGTGSVATFTLALSNAPNDRTTIIAMVEMTGDNPHAGDYMPSFSGAENSGTLRIQLEPINSQSTILGGAIGSEANPGLFVINTTNNIAEFNLRISPGDDDLRDNNGDATDEIVTFIFDSIEFPEFTLGPSELMCVDVDVDVDCMGVRGSTVLNSLSLTIIDDDLPEATYALTGPGTAIEPTSDSARNAVASSFTITLSNLNTAQTTTSNARRFFFNFEPSDHGLRPRDRTPGYGSSLPSGLQGAAIANMDDFDLDIVYTPAGNTTVTVVSLDRRIGVYDTPNVDKADETAEGEEVYTFRLTPRYDNNVDEGIEHVVFGYRVFFAGGVPDQVPGGENRLNGVVNGGDGDPAITIDDGPRVTLTRDPDSITEGATNSSATLTLTLDNLNVSNGTATIISMITITGDNPSASDFSAELEGVPVSAGIRYVNTIDINNNTAALTLNIRPLEDDDSDNERITYAITSIELPNLTLGPGDFDGALSINIIDDDIPKATYALTGRGTTIEPTSGAADNAVASSFTITLSNLNTSQTTTSNARRFFFRFESSGFLPINSPNHTPGYGSLHSNLAGAAPANTNDLNLEVVYTPAGNTTLTVASLARRNDTHESGNLPKAGETDKGEEVYTFRLTPRHDNNVNEGIEHVVFGYRVFFAGGVLDQARGEANRLDGVVTGGDGDPAITIVDGARVTLTRDQPSITEGTTDSATLTLALGNVPNGKSTITSTITITGDNPSTSDFTAQFEGMGANAEIRYVGTTGFLEDRRDTGSFIIDITDGNPAGFTLNISPLQDDGDSDNEIITYAITSIKLPNLTLGPLDFVCSACNSDGELTITIRDNETPAATYALTGPQAASEPITANTNDAVASSFTITLSNLKARQRRSTARRFFFRFEPSDHGLNSRDRTPGYGSPLPPGLQDAAIANMDDFDLRIVYTPAGNTTVTDMPLDRGNGIYDTPNVDKAGETAAGKEVYTFRLTPRHDPRDNGIEHVVFGYRVFFAGGVPDQALGQTNRLDGVVNGDPSSTPVMAITDMRGPSVTLKRNRPFITEGTEGTDSSATFTLELRNAPDGRTTVISRVEMTGDNPHAGDYMPSFSGAENNDALRIQLEPINSQSTILGGAIGSDANPGLFVINTTTNTANFNLHISPGDDDLDDDDGDATDETVTFIFDRIVFPEFTFFPGDIACRPTCMGVRGSTVLNRLSLIIRDDDIPKATYALTGRGTAVEPTSDAAGNAVASSFTITLSDLNTSQTTTSNARRFFFNFNPSSVLAGINQTPGYDSLDSGLGNATPANANDLNLEVVYTPAGNTTLTVASLDRRSNTHESDNLPKAGETAEGEEVYTFRLTPRHDNDVNEGMEHVVFGYRVFFAGGVRDQEPGRTNRLDGMVNGGDGDPAITIVDGARVTLTRDQPSITEDTTDSATLTLALGNVPNGKSTITSTITITGDAPSERDIVTVFTGPDNTIETDYTDTIPPTTSVAFGDDTDFFTITITNNTAAFTLNIRPGNNGDLDSDNETITYAITSIKLPNLTLGPSDFVCEDCSSAGALSIRLIDGQTPAATYALPGPGTAFEPTSAAAGNAIASSFTITLSDLNTAQTRSNARRFFFNFEPSDHGLNPRDRTPGYGSLHRDLQSTATANFNDFDLDIVYTPAGNTAVTVIRLNRTAGVYETPGDVSILKAGETAERKEVYTFRLTPGHDNVDEGIEYVVFGYRVFFVGGVPAQASDQTNRLDGMVNGAPSAPAITINDANNILRLRIRTFLEGALQ